LSDSIDEIKRHLGLEVERIGGKRHEHDIGKYIRYLLKAIPGITNEQIFGRIKGTLMANYEIESPYGMGYTDEDKKKKMEEWEKKIKPEWLDRIEAEREMFLSEEKRNK